MALFQNPPPPPLPSTLSGFPRVRSGLVNPPSFHSQQTWNNTSKANPTVDSSGYNFSSGYGPKSGWGPLENPPNNSRQNMVISSGQNNWQNQSSSIVSAQPRFSDQPNHDNRQATAGPPTSAFLSNYSHNNPNVYSHGVPPPKVSSSNQPIFQQKTNLNQNCHDVPPPEEWNPPNRDLQQDPRRMNALKGSSTSNVMTAGVSSLISPSSFVTSRRESEVIDRSKEIGWTSAGPEQRTEANFQRQSTTSNQPRAALPNSPTKLQDGGTKVADNIFLHCSLGCN